MGLIDRDQFGFSWNGGSVAKVLGRSTYTKNETMNLGGCARQHGVQLDLAYNWTRELVAYECRSKSHLQLELPGANSVNTTAPTVY